jgi:hypothetical protein
MANSGPVDPHDVVPLGDSHPHPVHLVYRHDRTRPGQHFLTD